MPAIIEKERKPKTRIQAGFSLLELAIAIVILAAILGSVVVPVATQVQAKKIKETEQLLEDVKDSLMGFALSNSRLPCPDDPATAGITGTEDRPFGPPLGACNALEGFLPWTTLGVSPTDAWGRLWHYGVVSEFTFPSGSGPPVVCSPGGGGGPAGQLDLCDTGNIDVQAQTGTPSLANDVPAVVLSHGPNGWGGTDPSGSTLWPPPAGITVGADEQQNRPGTPILFILRPYMSNAPAACNDAGAPLCNFDDLVVWLSTPILFNRMVAAGRLP